MTEYSRNYSSDDTGYTDWDRLGRIENSRVVGESLPYELLRSTVEWDGATADALEAGRWHSPFDKKPIEY